MGLFFYAFAKQSTHNPQNFLSTSIFVTGTNNMTAFITVSDWIKLLAGLVVLFVLSACSDSDEINTEPLIQTVRIETVSANTTLSKRHFVGRIEAVSTVDLSFQVSGRLIKLPTQQGGLIKKGQVIAALEQADYLLAVNQAKTQLHQAKLDVIRKRNLFRSGSLPKAMLDEAETAFKLQQLALNTTQRNLAYTRIIAPFDVLVTRRLLDNFTNVAANQAIVRVQDMTELRVHINVPENLMKLLGKLPTLKAEAVFKDKPKQRFLLRYREHITEADSIAQTYEVVFALSRQDNLNILSGMNVTVIIGEPSSHQVSQLFIPVSAIDYDEQGAARAWVFNQETQTVSAHSINLGVMRKKDISVLSGLKQGEKIVTAGAQFLREGMTVRPFTSFK